VAVGATVGFFVARRDYMRGQRWQKAQILLKLIDAFERDERIAAACKMLDWDAREVKLSDGRSIEFRNDILLSALRVPAMDMTVKASAEHPHGFTAEEEIIRDCLDAFFDFFHKLYAFWTTGLLNFEDYAYFQYWFGTLYYIGEYKGDEKIGRAIKQYITSYKFVGINELMKEYSKDPEPKMDLTQEATLSLNKTDGR
jgi:hypothetical protein